MKTKLILGIIGGLTIGFFFFIFCLISLFVLGTGIKTTNAQCAYCGHKEHIAESYRANRAKYTRELRCRNCTQSFPINTWFDAADRANPKIQKEWRRQQLMKDIEEAERAIKANGNEDVPSDPIHPEYGGLYTKKNITFWKSELKKLESKP